jgi:antitoxin (DNA-binding transcriptional repressor) of toxin-antitoxin stability system
MATTVNMSDAKSSLSKLAARAAAGEDIFIARAGKPVAMLLRRFTTINEHVFLA